MTVESFYCNTTKHQKNTDVHTDLFLPRSNQPHLDSTLAHAAVVKLPLVCRAKRVRSQAVFQIKNLFRVVNVFFPLLFFHRSSFPLHDSWHHSAVNGFLFRLLGLWPWHSLLHAVCYIGFLHYTPLWVKCRSLYFIVHSISFCNEAELWYMFFSY